jgi:glycosyltransferase involved in cell wall biosynthesis
LERPPRLFLRPFNEGGPSAADRLISSIGQVVPPVLRDFGEGLEVDVDFAEALGVYLEHSFSASWLGDGPLLDATREKIRLHGLHDVTFAGYVSGRATVLRAMKAAHIFQFTHITLESSYEQLACGCPIVDYGSAYAADLAALSQRPETLTA